MCRKLERKKEPREYFKELKTEKRTIKDNLRSVSK